MMMSQMQQVISHPVTIPCEVILGRGQYELVIPHADRQLSPYREPLIFSQVCVETAKKTRFTVHETQVLCG